MFQLKGRICKLQALSVCLLRVQERDKDTYAQETLVSWRPTSKRNPIRGSEDLGVAVQYCVAVWSAHLSQAIVMPFLDPLHGKALESISPAKLPAATANGRPIAAGDKRLWSRCSFPFPWFDSMFHATYEANLSPAAWWRVLPEDTDVYLIRKKRTTILSPSTHG
jgi:hypothetical protein